ncbi:glycosyltransferase family 2 protein [Candidatus Shapirobacteria bacterium]|nr:glycosyltransferase family 2 protein [Candidatus Shapirobacteria bacterium]
MILSVIILSYNTRELLEQCLNSVINSLSCHPDPIPKRYGANESQDLLSALTQIPDPASPAGGQVRNDGLQAHHSNPSSPHPGSFSLHPDSFSCHPESSSRHPDSLSCHPESSSRHPDESQDLPSAEIIVVDNHSQDDSVEMLENLKFKIKNLKLKIIVNNDNLGFAKANNQGIKESRGKYILLLNSDTIVKDKALEKMVSYLEENPQVGGVSPLLLNADGSAQIDYYMRFPNLWQIFFYHNRLLRPLAMKSPLVNLICFPVKKVPYPVDQLPGAAMMARRKVWQKVGLLDEDYPFYFEDVDWAWRAKKMGQKLMVLPQAEIIHLGGGSWKKGKARPEEYYRQFFASMAIFLKKNYPPFKREIMLAAIKANLGLKEFIKKILRKTKSA